jgi:acetyl-CoA acetyltransferase
LHVLEQEVLAPLIVRAVAQSGVDRADIGSVIFTVPRPYTRQKYLHTFIIGQLRLAVGGTVMEVMGNGMTGALAFDQACAEIQLGRAKVALAVGINMESATPASVHMMESMRATGDVDFQAVAGIPPIAWYAMDAARYMYEHGATRKHLAAVAVKNRWHASLNPLAQFRTPIDLEDVLAARPIVEPLGLLDVPGRADGAACLVLATETIARSLGRPYVLLRGRGFDHDGTHQISDRHSDITSFAAVRRASDKALTQAGLALGDVDVAELYAPCTIVEILVSEAIGFFPAGQGGLAALNGETRADGGTPLSTSGGLTSRGHPAYVTSLYNVGELYDQLTDNAGFRQVSNARIGLSTGELGNYNAALVHVLEAKR